MDIQSIISHIRNWEYMSGIDRDKIRIKETEECFTPLWLVQKGLDEYEKFIPDIFSNPTKTFIDNSCGDSQFLGEVLIRKLESLKKDNITDEEFKIALSTIYGVDLMPDNVKLSQDRLLCGQEHLRHIVEKNIVCHDALTYDYSFNGTNENTPTQFETLFQEC